MKAVGRFFGDAGGLLFGTGLLNTTSKVGRSAELAGAAAKEVNAAKHVGDVGGTLQTGGRQVLDPNRIEGWDAAERVYGAIRTDKSDIAAIATNTNMPEATIARIKAHVFDNTHLLDSGLRRFDADPNIVNAWGRLKEGDFLQSDLSFAFA